MNQGMRLQDGFSPAEIVQATMTGQPVYAGDQAVALDVLLMLKQSIQRAAWMIAECADSPTTRNLQATIGTLALAVGVAFDGLKPAEETK